MFSQPKVFKSKRLHLQEGAQTGTKYGTKSSRKFSDRIPVGNDKQSEQLVTTYPETSDEKRMCVDCYIADVISDVLVGDVCLTVVLPISDGDAIR